MNIALRIRRYSLSYADESYVVFEILFEFLAAYIYISTPSESSS